MTPQPRRTAPPDESSAILRFDIGGRARDVSTGRLLSRAEVERRISDAAPGDTYVDPWGEVRLVPRRARPAVRPAPRKRAVPPGVRRPADPYQPIRDLASLVAADWRAVSGRGRADQRAHSVTVVGGLMFARSVAQALASAWGKVGLGKLRRCERVSVVGWEISLGREDDAEEIEAEGLDDLDAAHDSGEWWGLSYAETADISVQQAAAWLRERESLYAEGLLGSRSPWFVGLRFQWPEPVKRKVPHRGKPKRRH